MSYTIYKEVPYGNGTALMGIMDVTCEWMQMRDVIKHARACLRLSRGGWYQVKHDYGWGRFRVLTRDTFPYEWKMGGHGGGLPLAKLHDGLTVFLRPRGLVCLEAWTTDATPDMPGIRALSSHKELEEARAVCEAAGLSWAAALETACAVRGLPLERRLQRYTR